MSREVAQLLEALDARATATAEVRRARREFDVCKLTHSAQWRLIQDRSQYVVVTTGRRAGKTGAAVFALLDRALERDDVQCFYITSSRPVAKRLVWRPLKKLNERYRLGGIVNETELSLSFPNGSQIHLAGADSQKEIDKLRGMSRVALVIVDEAQRFNQAQLQDLVDEVVDLALLDVGGAIWLMGTPAPSLVGTFWDAWNDSQKPDGERLWSGHRFTMLDNSFMSASAGMPIAQVLAAWAARRKYTPGSVIYQREAMGIWIADPDALVYRYDPTVNDLLVPLPRLTTYIIAADIGYRDADAVVVLGWDEDVGIVYLVEEHVTRGQTVTQLGKLLRRLHKTYEPVQMVADSGGGGLKTIETIKQDLDIPLEPAEKPPVVQQATLLNDALRTGRLVAPATSRFAQDCRRVTWVKGIVGGKVDEAAYHSDVIPAVRYGWLAILPLLPGYEDAPPPPKTIEQQQREQHQLALRRREAARRGRRLVEDDEASVFDDSDIEALDEG